MLNDPAIVLHNSVTVPKRDANKFNVVEATVMNLHLDRANAVCTLCRRKLRGPYNNQITDVCSKGSQRVYSLQ